MRKAFAAHQNENGEILNESVDRTVEVPSPSTVIQWMCHCVWLASAAALTAAYAAQLSVQLRGPELTAPGCKYANTR